MIISVQNEYLSQKRIDPKNAEIGYWYKGEATDQYYWCIEESKNAEKIFLVYSKRPMYKSPIIKLTGYILEKLIPFKGKLLVNSYEINVT